MVTWETALLPPLAHQQCTSRHRRRPGRWQVDPARPHAGLAKDDHSTCDWKRLCLLARHCQYRPHSHKFKDSPELKRLCRPRNGTAEAAQRASISRHIIATRRAERAAWLNNLYTAASSGVSSAIAFLRAQHKATSTWSHLLAHSGSQPAAINKVKDHFQQVFAKTPPNSRAADCTPHLATLQAHMAHTEPQPIHADEVHQALIKLKPGKTSGASGMSNEFLVALSHTDAGLTLLLRLLNTMFLQGLLHPDLLLGIACLIPKAANITMASQIRPILLLEVVQKVYASILMRRLAHHWPPITAQLGAVPGGQPIEALFAAQHMIALATVTDKQPLFLKLDIKGAFDNLRHASVAAFLATLPAPACYESMRLLSLLLEQKIHLSFLHDHWELHTSNGTPQGGSHSAGLFARTLDHAIGQLLRTWEAAGHSPVFPPLWLLLFVDDILLCFRGWVQAIRLLPSFLECLSTLGLEVNYAKSCLVLSPALRSSPPPSPSLELLKRFPWVENTQYLRKPFGYRLEVDAVHHQSLQLIYGACGKLKPVLKRCHWTNPLSTSRLLDQYVGSAFLWLSPALHPYQQFRHKLRVVQTTLLIEALNLYIPAVSDNTARQLLRFRRRIVKRWILHMTPSGS